MSTETRQALTERRDLIEARADAQLVSALQNGETWTVALGPEPKDTKNAATWRRHARTVAAYRDRYNITGPAPLGAPEESAAQKIDAARAGAALDRTRTTGPIPSNTHQRTGRSPARSSL